MQNQHGKISCISVHQQRPIQKKKKNQRKNETKETIQFAITSKRIKYLGVNLTKGVKGLYTENYKILLKEIREDTKEWEDSIAIKCPYHPEQFNAILKKIPMTFVGRNRKEKNAKTDMESQGIPNRQNNLGKGEQTWRPQAY